MNQEPRRLVDGDQLIIAVEDRQFFLHVFFFLFRKFAIEVIPAAVFTGEAACFVQPVSAAVNLVASDEFDDRRVFASLLVAFDL